MAPNASNCKTTSRRAGSWSNNSPSIPLTAQNRFAKASAAAEGVRDTGYGIRGIMSYKNLQIWQLARELSIEVHQMALRDLPKFENFEEASQIRRSMKSVRSNIVEGYGRRRYKQDYIRFLTYAHASCDETIDHLEILEETGSLSNQELYQDLHQRLNTLGAKLNRFIQSVQSQHNNTVREDEAPYNE